MIDFDDYPLVLVLVVSAVAMIGVTEIARPIGRRSAGRGGGNVGTIEASVLGLLALMISFTFAMALSRFDARRDALLQEANAIGTTALRSRLLPPPHNREVMNLLREYVQLRLDLTKEVPSQARLDSTIRRSNQIQELLWRQAMAAKAADPGMVPTGVFIQSLNEMIDSQERRLTALRNRVPRVVLLSLYGIALLAGALIGYADGREPPTLRLPVYLLSITVVGVLGLIQDLDGPAAGFIMVSQQPMFDVAASLAAP